ncbi:MAG: tryptophan--tRNA ligase, partial [bacterium]|nr:tryptophan--tRNA ligase [bacterium]
MMKKRILSGMRPTGKLHLGNYVGALENWVKLQGEYENFHLVADWHLLTTDLDTSNIKDNTVEMVIDWLSAGIDAQQSPIFIQSKIKQHAELFLLFSMLVSVPRLERNPTVKEQAKDLGLDNNMAYGHLGYPVLQAADILLYQAHLVPVGEDQMP